MHMPFVLNEVKARLLQFLITLWRWLPLAAFGPGPGIKGLVGFSFQLQRLGGKLFG